MTISYADQVAAMFADLPDRLDRASAARAVGKTPRTIDRWIAAGDLPAFRVGRSLLIAKSDLLAMIRPVRAAS